MERGYYKGTYGPIFLLTNNRNSILSVVSKHEETVVLELVADFLSGRVNPADTSWNQTQRENTVAGVILHAC